jgi:hypothetical protein
VSERKTTNMTMTEIRRFMDAKRKREAKARAKKMKFVLDFSDKM